MQTVEDFIRAAAREFAESERPLVTLSYAQSLDGSIAYQRGVPLTLSGSAALKMTHRLRALHDGILVGIGTVLADDPQLTVRHAQGEHPQPIVLDSRLRIPRDARLLENPNPPWVFAGTPVETARMRDLHALGCQITQVEAGADGNLPLVEIMVKLRARGIRRLMVEGGAAVISSFLKAGTVDLVVLTIAPRFVGGLRAPEKLDHETQFPKLSPVYAGRAGDDILIWGRFSRAEDDGPA